LKLSASREGSGLADGLGFLFSEIVHRQHFTVSPFQTPTLIGGDDDDPIPSIAGCHNWLHQSRILIAADFFAKFSGRYADHVEYPHFPDIPDVRRNWEKFNATTIPAPPL
jgi:hypothetical protein